MSQFFYLDSLAKVSTVLIVFIAVTVLTYSRNYLRGDSHKSRFFLLVFLLTLSLVTTFSADNIFLFCSSWIISNAILVLLMIHKTSWKQSVASGIMALKNFLIGSLALFSAAAILYFETNTSSISAISSSEFISNKTVFISSIFILIAALTQSAIYPFHSWLISSLNSPTPVSAIMHAGLVNGGGILLVRFSEIFFRLPEIMTLIFVIGIFSAIIGTLWKLIQSNVKGMLACSTMSQMGFMIAQCGMGLFPAAIAHLFWHGMFKSYLFLSSPGSWRETRLDLQYPPQISSFLLAIICGVSGAAIFTEISGFVITNFDTTLVLIALCFIAASQGALIIINKSPLRNFVPALLLSSITSALYASSVTFIERILPPELFNPQSLNFYHIIALALLSALWFANLFLRQSALARSQFFMKCYMKLLNASQPKFKTITANRNQYNYQ
jgi:NAD(P)H-quinone oxidoreductase subunit 5